MTIQPGSRLGPYEILAVLGQGGMGEVYRARDSRLNRDVAIKVLARTDNDAAQQRRLLEEAQAASALNHPNIVAVYDVGTAEGMPFIVSELVAGTSLRALVARAPLPIREVLDLAVQMADGLGAAHQAGIAHRDFKPENVMVAADGRVKILDFGLARRSGDVAGAEDARTVTVSSAIVGTVPYMSPEQARGAAVDYRTDQFSLGLTLYELLTGRRAFSGDSAAQLLASIIEDEPEPLLKANARVPAPLRWTIERCLAKEARQRYDTTADLARELHTLRDRLAEFGSSAEFRAPADAGAPRRRGGRRVALGLAGAVLMMAIGLTAGLSISQPSSVLDRYRFTPLATDSGYQASPAWSPDGKTLAYVAEVDGVVQIFTRALASAMRAQVTHSMFDCADPFWSPDGTRIYYTAPARSRNGLWSISAVGGDPELVMENVNRAALSPDGKTLAVFRSTEVDGGFQQLWLSSPPGAPPVAYTRPPFGARRGYLDARLHFSPDGSKLGVSIENWWAEMKSSGTDVVGPEFWVLPINDAAPYVVSPPASDAQVLAAAFSWMPDSRRVLSALPFPRPGLHLWATDTVRDVSHPVTTTSGMENDPAVSPDGTHVAVALQTVDYDVYQLAVDSPVPTAVLSTSRSEMDPSWSSSGRQLVFTTDRMGHEEIWLRSERGDWERPLVRPGDFGADQTQYLASPALSPDGQRVAYLRQGAEGNRIWITPVAGGPPVRLSTGDYFEDSPSWSPDGAWIAFAQATRGEWALARIRVGTRTASEVLTSDVAPDSRVRWAPDGASIAYNSANGLSIVSTQDKSVRTVNEQGWMGFDWSVDSRRLFGVRPSDDGKHLTFGSVDVTTGEERVLHEDFWPLPISPQPVKGFSRVTPTTFLTSLARVRSDIWLLDGFDWQSTLRERLGALLFWRKAS